MLVVQMLLPRFLVLEIVLFFHFLQESHCQKVIYICSLKSEAGEVVNSNNRSIPVLLDEIGEYQCDLSGIHEAKWPPLILNPNGDLYLNGNQSSLIFSCPGGRLKTEAGSRDNLVTCSRDSGILVNENGVDNLKGVSCSRKIREDVLVTSNSCGPVGGTIVHIGWTFKNHFYRQITVCHDLEAEVTYFANHTLIGDPSKRSNFTNIVKRPAFKEGSEFFRKSSASSSYKLKHQERILRKFGENYFKRGLSRYLAKGHLAPDADFDGIAHVSLSDATYRYINVAPQWQSFNNGNWKGLESAIRSYADRTAQDLKVYTGTYGVLSLNGTRNRLYLGEGRRIPVPEIFWKILHNPKKNEALVFVGSNDIFSSNNKKTLCPDLCSDVHWKEILRPDNSDPSKGYLYCCAYQKFRKVVPWIPDLGNPYLLQNRL